MLNASLENSSSQSHLKTPLNGLAMPVRAERRLSVEKRTNHPDRPQQPSLTSRFTRQFSDTASIGTAFTEATDHESRANREAFPIEPQNAAANQSNVSDESTGLLEQSV